MSNEATNFMPTVAEESHACAYWDRRARERPVSGRVGGSWRAESPYAHHSEPDGHSDRELP